MFSKEFLDTAQKEYDNAHKVEWKYTSQDLEYQLVKFCESAKDAGQAYSAINFVLWIQNQEDAALDA